MYANLGPFIVIYTPAGLTLGIFYHNFTFVALNEFLNTAFRKSASSECFWAMLQGWHGFISNKLLIDVLLLA